MNTIQNFNPNNLNFQARLRFRKKKKHFLSMPVLLSSAGVFSTGAVSGYGYGHYGADVFKPSVIKEKVLNTKKSVDETVTDTKNKANEEYQAIKENLGLQE